MAVRNIGVFTSGVAVIVTAFVFHGLKDIFLQARIFTAYKGLIRKMSDHIIELEDAAKSQNED